MDPMEEKLGAILNNPQMMQQIMGLAQSLNQTATQKPPEPSPAAARNSGPDMNTMSRLMSLAQKTGIDRNQQSLLRALSPYLSKNKLSRLERAMQAARMAGLASNLLGPGGRSTGGR